MKHNFINNPDKDEDEDEISPITLKEMYNKVKNYNRKIKNKFNNLVSDAEAYAIKSSNIKQGYSILKQDRNVTI